MKTIPALKHPTSIFSSKDLEIVRQSERLFLSETGIQDVLQEKRIEYINITEEVLDNRTVDENDVRQIVENHYPSVLNEELYQFVPKKLYDLRSGTFINFAKFKVFFSMCTKNMFGMIPEHVGYDSRYKMYHGKNDKDLSRNIIDINKIYHALFNICGVVEAINSLSYNTGDPLAKRTSGFGYRYDVLERPGMIYYCDNPLWLDAFIHRQCGKDPMETKHLKDAGEIFGSWRPELIQIAKNLSNPIPV
jgi:hypothetical protein